MEQAQKQWREAEERRMQEDEELVAELVQKAEERQRRQRLDEAEKKQRETEKAKGKKRKADHRLLALLLTIYQHLSTGHCAQYQ